MHNRYPDRHSAPRLPRIATRRALLAGAAGLLIAGAGAGFLPEDAAARRVRNRRRNRNHNRSQENSVSIPGQPGQPGEDGND